MPVTYGQLATTWARKTKDNQNSNYSSVVPELSITGTTAKANWIRDLSAGPSWVYGATVSPNGNIIVVHVGELGKFTLALNPTTGETTWQSADKCTTYSPDSSLCCPITVNDNIWGCNDADNNVSVVSSSGTTLLNELEAFSGTCSGCPVVGDYGNTTFSSGNQVICWGPYGMVWASAALNGNVKGPLAIDTSLNIIAITTTGYIYSLDPTDGTENWSSNRPGNNIGGDNVASPPYVLPNGTIITYGNGEMGGVINFFTEAGVWSYLDDNTFSDSSVGGFVVYPDSSYAVAGRSTLAKYAADNTQTWKVNTKYSGLDPGIIGLISDGDKNCYIWHDLAGICIYDSSGTFVDEIGDTDLGGGFNTTGSSSLSIAEDGSLIFTNNQYVISLTSGAAPAVTPSRYSMISGSNARRGVGTDSTGQGVPWGP